MALRTLSVWLLAFQTALAVSAPSLPTRKLPWGQLNFLHTTDTHGWFAGHLQEAQYSADWGDYVSFAHHLRQRADADGSDLLVIDTGDRGEGNGLYDASRPKGKYTLDIVKQQHMDIITLGNHELYSAETTDLEYQRNLKNFKDSYISSNVDVIDPETGRRTSIGPRYRKFTTKNQGITVLAFGFLFDFVMNSNHSIIQPVEQTVKEEWFLHAIRDRDIEIFVVAGHVAPRVQTEFDTIFHAIRAVRHDVPIQFLGGHSHIRDCVKYDDKAYALQSGRYMETIGFASVSGIDSTANTSAAPAPRFERLYIDNNLGAYKFHTGLDDHQFATEHGANVSAAIAAARKAMSLDKPYGCAPRDFWLDRAPFGADDSLLTLLANDILPDVARNQSEERRPQMIINNSGSIRFNIFKGHFSVDTALLISPFTSRFKRIGNVPYASAKQMMRLLNNQGPIQLSALLARRQELDLIGALEPLEVQGPNVNAKTLLRSRSRSDSVADTQVVLDANNATTHGDGRLSFGYTTSDDLGDDGDDTAHRRMVFYDTPNCISSEVYVDAAHPPDRVDLLYNEYVQPWIFLALRFLGLKYTEADTDVTFDRRILADLITDWVKVNWKCE